MFEFLRGDCGKNIVGIIGILTLFGSPFFLAGWAVWLKHRRKELKLDLKREMLAAGMSADDIVRVLNAGDRPGDSGSA